MYLKKGELNESMVDCVSAWIYRETMCYVWFCRGACDPYVKWRGSLYKLKWGGSGVRVVEDGRRERRTACCWWRKRGRRGRGRGGGRQVHPNNDGYVLREIIIQGSPMIGGGKQQQQQQQRVNGSSSMPNDGISTIFAPAFYNLFPFV